MKFPIMQPCITPDDEMPTGGGGGGGGTPPESTKENEQPGTPTPPATTPKAEPEQRSTIVPRERFDAVNAKYRELQDTHTTLSASYQAALNERDTAKTDAEQAKTRATQLEAALTAMLETRVASLPEDKRDLIPEGLSVDQKLVWIERAAAKGIFDAAPQQPIGTPTNPSPKGTALNIENMSPGAMLAAGYGAQK